MTDYTVKEIMSTKLVTVSPDESIFTAAKIIKEKKIRQLPVCQNGKIVGIITDRDLRQILGSNYSKYSDDDFKSLSLEEKTISTYMTSNPVTISQNTPVEQAITIINTKKFGSLPVCDENHTLIGIITVTDISGLLLKLLQKED